MKLSAGVLSERNFRLLFFARTISFFGTNLAPIAVAFAVLDLTGSATDVGIAFACWTLDRKSTRLNSSHSQSSYAVFCLEEKQQIFDHHEVRVHHPAVAAPYAPQRHQLSP